MQGTFLRVHFEHRFALYGGGDGIAVCEVVTLDPGSGLRVRKSRRQTEHDESKRDDVLYNRGILSAEPGEIQAGT